MSTPIAYRWSGEAMEPLKRYHNEAAAEFERGKVYWLSEEKGRSQRSHNHYFACIQEGWQNLPEIYAQEFPSPEHLRKHCLIKAGYHDSEAISLSNKDDALKVASYIRRRDEFSIVRVEDSTVIRYTAKSQSTRAMGAKDFQASKTKVLDLIDDMLGVERGQTAANAGQAA